jgi:hypothetical protein
MIGENILNKYTVKNIFRGKSKLLLKMTSSPLTEVTEIQYSNK